MAKLKQNIPSKRKKEKKYKIQKNRKSALAKESLSVNCNFRPSNSARVLRSSSRTSTHEVVDLRSEDDLDSDDELTFTPSRRVFDSATSLHTPQHLGSLKSQQKRKSIVKSTGYITPPDSGRSSGTRQIVDHHFSKNGISNFRANLDASSHAPGRLTVDDDGVNDVQVVGTQVNIKYRKPGHCWTLQERTALCILRRFHSADLLSVTAVLNGLFPKVLVPFTPNMVEIQHFEIRAGRQCKNDADNAWDYTWRIADFELACRQLEDDLEKLEEVASEVGAAITRRFEEDSRNFLQANSRKEAVENRSPSRPVKSIQTSNTKTRIVRPNQVPMSRHIQIPSPKAVRRDVIMSRQAAVIPSVEHDDPIQDEAEHDRDVPTLLFRAFSSESAGLNSEEGFRAGRFIGRMNAVPPPLNPNSKSDYAHFAWDASNHLSPARDVASKIATPFISLSPSLIWCVQRLFKVAGEDESKQFAIINGPMVEADTRLYRTGPILQKLKNDAMYSKRVWYKATMEWFAWAEIREEAISAVISRRHLEMLSEASLAVKSLLRLDVLDNTHSISQARAKFKADPLQLDGRIGMAIGKICLLFGISFHSDQAVITETIYHLLQGWAVTIDIDDSEAQQQAFSTFIGQLEMSDRSVALAHEISIMRPKLKHAFDKGIQQAAQQLLKESSQRPNQKTRYNRTNLYNRAIN